MTNREEVVTTSQEGEGGVSTGRDQPGSVEHEPEPAELSPVAEGTDESTLLWGTRPGEASGTESAIPGAVERLRVLGQEGAKYRRLVLFSDLLAIVCATTIGLIIGHGAGRPSSASSAIVSAVLTAPLWVVFAYAANLYHEFEQRVDRDLITDFVRLVIVSTAWIWTFVLVRAWVDPAPTDLLTPSVIWLSLLVLAPVGRAISKGLAHRAGWTVQRTAIVGDPKGIDALGERLARHPEWQLELSLSIELVVVPEQEMQSVDPGPSGNIVSALLSRGQGSTEGHSTLTGANEVVDAIEAAGVSRVLIAGGFGGYRDLSERTEFILALLDRGFAVDIVAGGPETVYSRALVQDYEGIPILSVKPAARRRLSLALKRALDIFLSAFGLALLSPLIAWVAIRIKLDSDGPVFFRQVRWGLDETEFDLIKFRTMDDGSHDRHSELREATRSEGNDDVLFKLEDDPRVTPFGKILRKWSIDEIPQLWNVLKGEMSMVGPRPLIPEEAAQADSEFAARASVKPGIAGPWQALGRSSIPFEDMIRLDYSYVMGASTAEDFRLLLKTVGAVVRRRGAM